MAIKSQFDEEERRALTAEEIRLGEAWLVDHRLHTRVPKADCLEMYELYLKGATLKELSKKFIQWRYEQIILAAVLDDWFTERESVMETVKKAVTEKVINSMVDQVNVLSSLVDLTHQEWIQEIELYKEDPVLNPKPSVRIANLKDLATVQEMMSKALASTAAPKVPAISKSEPPVKKQSKAKTNSAVVQDSDGKQLTVGDLLRMKPPDESQN